MPARLLALLVAVTASLAAAAPAQASDATLRKVIKAQDKKLEPVAEAYYEEVPKVESVIGRERASKAAKDLQAGIRGLRVAVVREKASSAKGKRARTRYIAGVDDFLAGLKTFERGIVRFDPDAPAAAKALFKKSAAQLLEAGEELEAAGKALGV